MPTPTNHDLHIMLTEIRSDIKAMLKEQHGSKEWQHLHEKSDSDHFTSLTSKLEGLNRYGASIAIVAGFIGALSAYIGKKLTGI